MNLIRKIFAALLVSLLVGGTAFAQVSPALQARINALGANPTAAQVQAVLEAAIQAGEVDINDTASVSAAVQAVVAAAPTADVGAVTQAVTQAVVAAVAASPTATPAQVAAVTQAASSGASAGAVQAVEAAAVASGTPVTAAAVQAAVTAASSGASQGAVTAAAASTNTAISASVAAVSVAASTGSSQGATAAVAASTAVSAVVSTAEVATASTTGSNTGATTAASNAGLATTTVTTTTTTAGGETVVTETEVVVDVEAPEIPDATENPIITVFTVQLSYGNFTVTFNDKDNEVQVASAGSTTVGTVVSGANNTPIDFSVIPGFNLARQNVFQPLFLAAATTVAGSEVLVVVPGNNIVVSPSS